MEINLYNLKKISLNEWYSSTHWTKRKQIKDNYKWIIRSQFKGLLSRDKQYNVEYTFNFKTKPLDPSNCAAMLKLIEDVVFADDKYDIILSIIIKSRKNKTEYVNIIINEITPAEIQQKLFN